MAYFNMSDETLMRRLVMKSITNMPDEQCRMVVAEYQQTKQLELVLTIGGVECDLVSFVNALEKDCNKAYANVRAEAIELAKEMVQSELRNVVSKLESAVDEIVDNIEFK